MRRTTRMVFLSYGSYLETGEYAKAIADFTEAIRLDPTRTDNCRRRGRCYAQKGSWR
jgi:tetratricopeptide (TPR) repeat protein